uniref:WH1 domain-containing protein n=1 Tax=Leersia perrieri TaxID=77586 RepID=A0A0D9W149_9ORYZ
MARGGSEWRRRSKVTPDLARDQEGTRTLNLTVLRRVDPAVADILMTAAHVVLYSFDDTKYQWSRKPVEGSLFIIKRNAQPRFQFVVMNRKNTENLTEDLLGGFEYEIQVPYIMYRNAAQETTGIWFFDPQECKQVGRLFSRIHNAFSRVSPRAGVSTTKSEFGDPEVVPAVSSNEDTIKLSTSSIMVPNDAEYKFLSAPPKAAAYVGATMDEANAIQSNKSVGMFHPSTHASPRAIPPQSPAIQSNKSVGIFHSSSHASPRAIPPPSLAIQSNKSAGMVCSSSHASPFAIPPQSPATHSNKSVGMVHSSTRASPSAISTQSPALHGLHPSQISSVPVMPLDAHRSSSTSIQPTNLANPLFFPPPMPSLQTASHAASSLCSTVPLHPPITVQQPQSAPLHQPVSLPTASSIPPYGMPLLQPFPPPNPSPFLTSGVSNGPVITRDQLKDGLLSLCQVACR